jgi:hypothetical protein
MKKNLLLTAAIFAATLANSQNIISGSNMNSASFWNNGGCTPEMGVFVERDYGGPSTSNAISEIDALTCMQQSVGITAGTVYTINFDGTRRTSCSETPNPASIRVIVTGVTSNTVYSSVVYSYSNVTWTGYTAETQIVSIPSGAADLQVRIDIVPENNPEGCGVIMDNFTMQATGTLPVALSLFNAAAKTSSIDLSWTTSSENNAAYFSIQRSKNGLSFTEIGKVSAANLNTGASYTFVDATPNTGLNYYRLQQYDKNGVFKTSGVVRASLGATDISATVYPTNVTGTLNYAIASPRVLQLNIAITNVAGKVISTTTQKFTTGNTQRSVDVSTLASGIYLLTVVDNTGDLRKVIKFTKN